MLNYLYYKPCQFGHTFMWSGSSAHPDSEPPEGLPCACGAVRYHRRNLTQYALDGAFCACPIFIPSYESTAAKCRLCGKPPRQLIQAVGATMSKVDELIAKLEGLKISHNTCEDRWYSCPKSGDCCDDRQEGCNCGADEHNAEVDELIAWVRSNIACTGQEPV